MQLNCMRVNLFLPYALSLSLMGVSSKLYKAQELLQHHPLLLRRGGVYPRPKPGHLPERVGIKPTPTDGDGLERYVR